MDTAEMYPVPTNAETQGYTDRTIASWLKQRPASFRDDVVLATKVRRMHAWLVVRASFFWWAEEGLPAFLRSSRAYFLGLPFPYE